MKKMCFLLSLLLVFSIGITSASAADDIKLYVNNEALSFEGDQPPVIQNGRTLVPFRAVFEKMGATVGWDNDSRLCSATLGGVSVSIQIDDTTVIINGTKAVESDVPAQIINSRTMVPLRVLSESVGADVDWDASTRTVTVTSPKTAADNTADNAANTPADSTAKSGITEQEAENIAYENAGIDPADAQYLNVRTEMDDGIYVYEIEFYANGTEYDYEINAETGDIVSMDKDAERIDMNNNNSASGSVVSGEMSSDKAVEIALSDAGVSKSQASMLKAERDIDDGIEIYDVEFKDGTIEYSYEIDANSGKILAKEIDTDD